MKKVFEKIISGVITCSGFITSLVILLIVVFLFFPDTYNSFIGMIGGN